MGATEEGSTREVEQVVVASTALGSETEPGADTGSVEEFREEEEIAVDGVRVSEKALQDNLEDGTVNTVLEEDVDISPNGSSLTSLAYMPKDMAVRFKNLYVYDNSFSVIPASTRLFKALRKIKYWSNEVKLLPDEIGELTELEEVYLKLSPTGLSSLPPLGKLNGLRALELHQAPALPSSATLTRDIAQIQSLTRLSVCHFSIS